MPAPNKAWCLEVEMLQPLKTQQVMLPMKTFSPLVEHVHNKLVSYHKDLF